MMVEVTRLSAAFSQTPRQINASRAPRPSAKKSPHPVVFAARLMRVNLDVSDGAGKPRVRSTRIDLDQGERPLARLTCVGAISARRIKSMPDGTATAHLLLPKLATTFVEGYSPGKFRDDVLAGLTVAVVALPLSMAIAVASGVSPERGVYTAIIGGALVSALGGSRYQVGGPAGAFIVLVAATVARFGLSGLLCAVFLSGLMLVGL